MSVYGDRFATRNRIAGVRGSLIVAREDGLTVDEQVMADIPGASIAALCATLFTRVAAAIDIAEFGGVRWLQLNAEGGVLFAAAPPDSELLLVIVAERDVNVGMVRLEAQRAIEVLA